MSANSATPHPESRGASTPGLLFVATDVAAEHDLDFNRWYDREHVAERVRIPGFRSGARYITEGAGRRYLGLYRTESLDVFTSPGYRAAFERQTAWSNTSLDRMREPMRRVCSIHSESGAGTGSHLAVLTLDADPYHAPLDRAHEAGRELATLDGFVASRLLVPDVTLSTPLPRETTASRPMQAMFLIESSTAAARDALIRAAAARLGCAADAAWRLALAWRLDRSELA